MAVGGGGRWREFFLESSEIIFGFISLSVFPSICLSFFPSPILCLSVRPSVRPSVRLSVCVSFSFCRVGLGVGMNCDSFFFIYGKWADYLWKRSAATWWPRPSTGRFFWRFLPERNRKTNNKQTNKQTNKH